MERIKTRQNRALRQQRVSRRIRGDATRPRLSIKISSRHVSAQLIDDASRHTLASSSTVGQTKLAPNLMDRAQWVGTDIGRKAKAAKIKSLVFDRGGKRYHGRVAALAEAIRAEGIVF